MKIETLTPEIAQRFFGGSPKTTAKGFAALRDGEPLCIGGVYHSHDRTVVFANVKPEMRAYPIAGMKLARKVMEMVKSLGVTVYAMADCDVEASGRFLEHLGFKHLEGVVYEWQN